MVIFHYGHDLALSRVISFHLEGCFKQINAPLLDVRGTWQHQRPVLHRADDAAPRYQRLSFVDNRGNSSFQKFPSKPGRRSCNFIFYFVDTSLNLADGCVEECRSSTGGRGGWSTRGGSSCQRDLGAEHWEQLVLRGRNYCQNNPTMQQQEGFSLSAQKLAFWTSVWGG